MQSHFVLLVLISEIEMTSSPKKKLAVVAFLNEYVTCNVPEHTETFSAWAAGCGLRAAFCTHDFKYRDMQPVQIK
jgi:hypothetical protein